ncbi:hypothetical protein PQO01_16200 [Lentisphaera marina]|uniref:hypothetical protein n=1 Tax=Lentisphaera marina TaxID=1111041 RepID=UPI00236544DF|nr:hypothetical protein [Lentisphaera marina]MDD7986494.1 hypothetical protein [Lentisphaera marina]
MKPDLLSVSPIYHFLWDDCEDDFLIKHIDQMLPKFIITHKHTEIELNKKFILDDCKTKKVLVQISLNKGMEYIDGYNVNKVTDEKQMLIDACNKCLKPKGKKYPIIKSTDFDTYSKDYGKHQDEQYVPESVS